MIGLGKTPKKLEILSLSELLKYCSFERYIAIHAIHAVNSEVKCGLKSNSVRFGQPTYVACDDNLDAQI